MSWCNLIFKMGHNTHEWTTYIPMPRVGAMGMWEQRIKVVYRNSKHSVRGQQAAWNNYYKEKEGQDLMETISGFWAHHGQGGYPEAHWVLVLAQNIEVGMDAQAHWSAIYGSWSVIGPGLSGSSELSMARWDFFKGCKGPWAWQWVQNIGIVQD